MDKPEKPKGENISGIFRKLFASRKNQNSDPIRKNRRWTAKPMATMATQENPTAETAARTRNQTASRGVSTPIQDIPIARPTIKEPSPMTSPAALPASRPAVVTPAPAKPAAVKRRFFEPAKTLPAFWTVASVLSMVVNLILIIVLILVGRELFVLKSIVGENLLGGLFTNFIYMDQAHIKTNITVANTIPISFTLPISQDTIVVLTQNTPINGANVRINTGGMTINSPANIILPAGTNLPVHLELNIPVNTTVPINIQVPVDIPLQETELHKPFIGLQQVVAPFYQMLQPNIKTPQDAPFCSTPLSAFCSFYFQQ